MMANALFANQNGIAKA